VCDFGDNPLTPANDPYVCNDKLISGEPFLESYNSVIGGEIYTSACDSNGHGTHTSTTAAGAPVGSAVVLGVDRGATNDIAPGAHVAVYKVCGEQGCFSSDSAAAVGQGIEDGVDVINFSISGGENPYTDGGRTGLPRRLRHRCLRVRLRREQRTGRGHRRPPKPVGGHRSRLHPGARVRVDTHRVRRDR